MCLKDAERMTNHVDPDHTAQTCLSKKLGSLGVILDVPMLMIYIFQAN